MTKEDTAAYRPIFEAIHGGDDPLSAALKATPVTQSGVEKMRPLARSRENMDVVRGLLMVRDAVESIPGVNFDVDGFGRIIESRTGKMRQTIIHDLNRGRRI